MTSAAIQPVLAQLRTYWRAQPRLRVYPGLNPTQLEQLEARLGSRLPEPFTAYLHAFGGFDEQDQNGFRFWPVAELMWVPQYDSGKFAFPGSERFLLFCDYLCWCWAFALEIGGPGSGSVAIIDGHPPRKIARSFGEFLTYYLADAAPLYDVGDRGPE